MRTIRWMGVLGLVVVAGLWASGSAWAVFEKEDEGTAPAYAKKSATEEKAIKSSAPGVNVQGESGGFDDYLNDDLFPEDQEVRVMDVDKNSRVVMDGGDDAAGVSFKKSYEKSPVTE